MVNTTKNKTAFRTWLLRISITLFLLIAAGMGVLWLYLADYQTALPVNWGQRIVQIYKDRDAAALAELCTDLPAVFQDKNVLQSYLTDADIKGDVFYYPGTAQKDSELVYHIGTDTQMLATVTLKKSGSKTFFGFEPYDFVSLSPAPLHQYTIVAPAKAKIMLNGEGIPDRYLVKTDPVVSCFTQIGVPEIQQNTYSIADFNTVKSLSAEGFSVIKSAEGTYCLQRTPDAAAQTGIYTFAEDYAKAYIKFATARGASRAPVLQMTHPQTALYDAIVKYGNEWGEIYTSDRYENLAVTDCTQYTDTEFSCKVSMDYLIFNRNGEQKKYDFDFTFYITRLSGAWKVVQMEAIKK